MVHVKSLEVIPIQIPTNFEQQRSSLESSGPMRPILERLLGSEEEPLSLGDASLDACSDGECLLECGGYGACEGSTFGCPAGHACTLDCSGRETSYGVTICSR